MSYGERAYFDSDHCQHVADRDEAARLVHISKRCEQHQRRRSR
jgi:hypothetical protein